MSSRRWLWAVVALAAMLVCLPALAGHGEIERQVVQTGDGTKMVGEGQVRYCHGVPFLTLSGSYYEMGLQYGILMRKELRDSFANFDAYRKAFILGLPWYARPFTELISRVSLWSMARRLPQEYQDELAGMAEGSGLDFDDILYCAFAPETFTIGCSTVVTREGGRLLVGRNLDYNPPSLGRFPIVISFNPEGRHRFTSVGFVGFLGVLTGFNEKGVAVSLDAVNRYRSYNSWDIPIAYKTRQILESAADLDEAHRLLRGYTSTRGWALTVADADELDATIFDLAGGAIAENRMSGKHLFVTNAFVNASFRRRYMTASMATHPFVQARYDMIARRLEAGSVDDVDALLDVLADVGTYGEDGVICGAFMTVNNSNTLQTIAIDPAAAQMVFACAPGYSGFGRFLRFTAGDPEVTVHREEDTRYREEIAPMFDWQEKAVLRLAEQDYKGLLIFTDISSPELGLQQVLAVYQAWKTLPELVDAAALAASLHRMSARYRDFILLPIAEAEVLAAMGQPVQAIALLEDTLTRPFNYPSTRLMAHELLAYAYHVLQNEAEAKFHARECIRIRKTHVLNRRERLANIRLSRILDPREHEEGRGRARIEAHP